MENRKIVSGLALLGTFCILSLSASEQATTNTETSKIAPQIFQKVGAYWKFIEPDALELAFGYSSSVSLFGGPGKGIKKLLFKGAFLSSEILQKLAQVFPNTLERTFDIKELKLFSEKEDDETVQKVLHECTDKLIGLTIWNKNLTLSWVDKLTCKNLQELNLSRMKLSHKKLQCILDKCPDLRRIGLRIVKDEPHNWSVSWKNQPKLEELRGIFQGGSLCTVPATFLEDLLKNCPKLKHFELDNSLSGINGIAWPKQLSLGHFELANDGSLNDGFPLNTLLAMIDAFPNLKYLSIPLLGTHKSQNEIQKLRIRAAKQLIYLKKQVKNDVVSIIDEIEEVDSESGSEDEGNEEI